MEITFSPVEDETSFAQAKELSAQLYHQDGLQPPHAEWANALKELAEHPELGGAWLIRADGTVAGYVVLTACFSLEFHGHFGLLDELYLEEPWRGKGLGSAALAFVDEQCRTRGWKFVRLEVSLENLRAQEVYRRAAYRVEERHLMTKWL